MTSPTTSIVTAVTAMLVAAVLSISATTAFARPPADRSRGMEQMHDVKSGGDPAMQRMHGLMLQGNLGMQRMMEQGSTMVDAMRS